MSGVAVGAAVAGGAASALVGGALGGGSASSGAAAADPFASERGQYQQQLKEMMTGTFKPTDPSYAWRLSQGMEATNRSAAASGMLNSGGRLTALTDYAQNQASTEYANQFSRLSQLAGANVGSPAAAGQIIASGNTGIQQAAGSIGNAVSGAIKGYDWGGSSGTVDAGTASSLSGFYNQSSYGGTQTPSGSVGGLDYLSMF